MKMMSSKVLKELRSEHERLQKHLAAVTQDVGPPSCRVELTWPEMKRKQAHGACGDVYTYRSDTWNLLYMHM